MEDKDLLYNHIQELFNSKSADLLKFEAQIYMYSAPELRNTKSFLETIDLNTQKEILKLIKKFNPNQLVLFLENLKYDLDNGTDAERLLKDTKDIKKKIFPKKVLSKIGYSRGCINTYIGFMRALNAGTLYTTKVNIYGKLKRVFIKTPIGNNDNINFNAGYFTLLLDPETMAVFSFATEKGKIKVSSLKEVYDLEGLEVACRVFGDSHFAEFAKNNYLNFRKKLIYKLNEVYGIERVVDTYLRMGGKIDPNKYPEIKEELIETLSEKFGTAKLLKWASKINDPKESAKLKLEILEQLGKKHGDMYKQYYNSEFKAARKGLNKGKPSTFKPKTSPKRPL